MANEHTVTTGANFIPELWSNEIQKFAQNMLVLAKRVKRFDSQVKGKGDTLHIPKIAEISAAAKSAGTDVSPTANTEGVVDLSINKHYYAAVDIEDILKVQSAYDLMEAYTQPLGYACSKQVDTDLAGLHSGLSQSVGTLATDLTDAVIVSAIQKLDEANAPEADRHFCIRPSAKANILKLDKFVLFQNVNQDRAVTGRIGEVYGVEVAVSNNITTTVTTATRGNNLMFHKEAFALAMQQEPRVQAEYELRGLSTLLVVDVIYGVVEYRDAYGVVVYN